eukprot:8908931-Ditylum_brightwellii.AAC.1
MSSFTLTVIRSESQDPTLGSTDHWQRVMQGHITSNMVPFVASNCIGTEVLLNNNRAEKQQIPFYATRLILRRIELVGQSLVYSETVGPKFKEYYRPMMVFGDVVVCCNTGYDFWKNKRKGGCSTCFIPPFGCINEDDNADNKENETDNKNKDKLLWLWSYHLPYAQLLLSSIISQFLHHCQWIIGRAASGQWCGVEGRLSMFASSSVVFVSGVKIYCSYKYVL